MNSQWESTSASLRAFRAEHKHWPRHDAESNAERNLYQWCAKQRRLWKAGDLVPGKIAILEDLGFPKDSPRDRQWQGRFAALQRFLIAHECMPSYLADPGSAEYVLFRWIDQQRADFKNGRMTKDRIDQLDAIGFVWDTKDHQWRRQYVELRRFLGRHGRMPRAQVEYNGETRLASWCRRQRREMVEGALPVVRAHMLNAIGFEWQQSGGR